MDNTTADTALASHSLYADQAAALALFKTLRQDDPVHRAEPAGYPPFWAVSQHADVCEVGRRNDIFSSDTMPFLLPLEELQAVRDANHGRDYTARTLVQMDEPDHKKYRGLTQAWFMPSNIKRLNDVVQAVSTDLIDKMESMGGACDFCNDVAVRYPLRVIMGLLGVPESDHATLLKWTQQMLGSEDPALQRQGSNRIQVVQDFLGYFRGVLADRRARPRDDLASLIGNSRVDEELIGEYEAVSYYLILATAGHDTTSYSLAGGLLALIQHPEALARLRAEPALMPSAVEEMFRWVTPAKHFIRKALQDHELHGKQIRKGDYVMILYQSANHDEKVFDRPEKFIIDRMPNKSIAFGFGPHACLGQHLARLNMKAMLAQLLTRVERIETAAPPVFAVSNQVGGLKSLPVRYDFVREGMVAP